MKSIKLWMSAAILICGTSVFTACSNDDDTDNSPSLDDVEVQLQK